MTNVDGLTAIDFNAYATSTTLLQDAGQGNFREIRDISTKWELANIAGNSTVNTFVSKYPLALGDIFYVVKTDNSIHELTNPIIFSRDHANATMTSNTAPSGAVDDSASSATAYYAFDGNEGTSAELLGVNSWIEYQLTASIKIRSFYLKCDVDYGIGTFRLEGSTDGISYATISIFSADQQIASVAGKQYEIQSPGVFTHYRIVVTSTNINNSTRINTFNLLLESGDSIDTTSITAGEIPTKVFRFSDAIEINAIPLVPNLATTEYDAINDKLKYNLTYNTATFNTNSLETTIRINTIGNSFKEIVSRLYKNV